MTLSAWGERGPFAGGRGFDSLVQAATGIATVGGRPLRWPEPAPSFGTAAPRRRPG